MFKKNWYRAEILPIIAVMGVAVGGAGWYVSRLARGPDVVWDRKGNPYPWNDVKEGQNSRLYAVNKEAFSKGSWKRERL